MLHYQFYHKKSSFENSVDLSAISHRTQELKHKKIKTQKVTSTTNMKQRHNEMSIFSFKRSNKCCFFILLKFSVFWNRRALRD